MMLRLEARHCDVWNGLVTQIKHWLLREKRESLWEKNNLNENFRKNTTAS